MTNSIILLPNHWLSYHTLPNPTVVFHNSGQETIQLRLHAGECISLSPEKSVNVFDCLKNSQDSTELNQIYTYPNPTSGHIYIDITQNTPTSDLYIYNAAGTIIRHETVVGQQIHKSIELDLPGFYYIRVVNEQFDKKVKILKI